MSAAELPAAAGDAADRAEERLRPPRKSGLGRDGWRRFAERRDSLLARAVYALAYVVARDRARQRQLDGELRAHRDWLESDGRAGRPLQLTGADLSGLSLRGADLRGAELNGCDLDRADLRGVNLGEARLRGCRAAGADFRGAGGRGAGIEDTLLRGANWRGSRLSVPRVERVDLRGAKLRRANWVGGCVRAAAARGADFRAAAFQGVAISDLDAGGGRWRAARFAHCDLRRVSAPDPRGAPTVRRCAIDGAWVGRADRWSVARPSPELGRDIGAERLAPRLRAHSRWLETGGREGERLRLRGRRLAGLDLRGADLRRAEIVDCRLIGCDAREARFDGAEVGGSLLERCRLSAARWPGARIERVTAVANRVGKGERLFGAAAAASVVETATVRSGKRIGGGFDAGFNPAPPPAKPSPRRAVGGRGR